MPISQYSGSKVRRRLLADQPGKQAKKNDTTWGSTTKLVVALAIFAILAWLFNRFEHIVGPLLFSVVLAYLLYPVAKWLSGWSHLSWRWSVSIIFLLLVVLLLGLITLGGLAVIEQAQSLIRFLDRALVDLPATLQNLSSTPITIGPFSFQPDFLDLNTLGQDLLGMVQPLLGRAGTLLGSIASGAANFLGLFFFTLLVAYFILAEAGAGSGQLIRINIPGFNEDFRKFGEYLSGIWNAFLRGQLLIILITILVYTILLGAMGLRFFIGLALLAGLARFVPYVGPVVAWTSYGLVAFFQGSTIFGLPPIWYVVLVVGVAWFTDVILDNLVGVRLMGQALQIHPAAVMVSALVGANLFGLVGVVLAAPVAATLKLLWGYVISRLLDQDPWETIGPVRPPSPRPIFKTLEYFVRHYTRRVLQFGRIQITRFKHWTQGVRNARTG